MPRRRVLLLLPVAAATLGPAAHSYDRTAGRLPAKKAVADAGRLVQVAQDYQGRRLKGKCVKLDAKHGTLLSLSPKKKQEARSGPTGWTVFSVKEE